MVGLGAIGGSVAWQAASSPDVRRVVAYTLIPREGVAAVRAGAVTELALNVERVVEAADFLVLAVPPSATKELLQKLAPTIVERSLFCTDVASVKYPITALAEELNLSKLFAGSHPLIGSQSSGFGAAEPDMFRGRVVYVTPLVGGEIAAAEVSDFWERVMGADSVTMDPATHDQVLAWTSHMPQAIASALAVTLGEQGPKGVTYGNGSRDTTKRAACNIEMWTDILLMNQAKVIEALEGCSAAMTQLRSLLQDGDIAGVREWLQMGARWREMVDNQ